MTKKQRERLEELRVLMNEKGAYRFGMDGESVTMAFRMSGGYKDIEKVLTMAFRMSRGYKDIEKVLYSVLTDDPENPYRDEDWEEGTEAMERLRNINDM
jgi:hypothetical protein